MSREIGYGTHRMRFKRFDLKDLCDHATIALIAKRRSGKSWLVKEIMKVRKDIPSWVIICRTEKLNSFYSNMVPDSYIYYNYEGEILDRIFARQKRLNEDNKIRKKIGKKEKDDRVMLIMDDCMSDKNWVKDPNIGELFFNGRHYHVSFILTMQYSKGLPPDMRGNLDYIFLLAEDFVCNRRRLYDDYAGMFPTFDIFNQAFIELTDNYGCMVIDNRTHTKDIEKKVFWYKADNIKDFELGCNKYKSFHKEAYDKKWDVKPRVFDYAKAGRKNKLNLLIEKSN
jgi:hypothetical protein